MVPIRVGEADIGLQGSVPVADVDAIADEPAAAESEVAEIRL